MLGIDGHCPCPYHAGNAKPSGLNRPAAIRVLGRV
jgi:hypothetical protein